MDEELALYDFQTKGSRFLSARRRAYLGDKCGLGKTIQAIDAAKRLGITAFVVCPAGVKEVWRREWERWGGPGTPEIISYSSLRAKPDAFLMQARPLVILDEAHYCKNLKAKRTRAALKLARRSKYTWCLSGTPMPNDPRELWSVVKYLFPEIATGLGIGSAFEWMDRFCIWNKHPEWGYQVRGATTEAKTQLAPYLRRVMLRRRLRDVKLELPPLRFTVSYLTADPKLDAKLRTLHGGEDPEHMATLRRVLGEYKAVPIVKQIVEELNEQEYDGIVILYHHIDTGRRIGEELRAADIGWFGFSGSSPLKVRQEAIDQFQAGAAPVFLAQQTAAGIGITLTRAHEIVLVEPSWSPEDNYQAIKRIHRIGQDKPCRARLFAVPGSLDVGLMDALRRKSEMIKAVIG